MTQNLQQDLCSSGYFFYINWEGGGGDKNIFCSAVLTEHMSTQIL